MTDKTVDYEIREKYIVTINKSLSITGYTKISDSFKKVAQEEIKERKALKPKLIMYCDEHKEIYQADIFPDEVVKK